MSRTKSQKKKPLVQCQGLPRDSGLPETASKPEKEYARMLEERRINGRIREWAFEPESFVLTRTCKETGTRGCRYTPDFRVVDFYNSVWFVEVKPATRKGKKGWGPWIREDAKIKMKMFAAHQPYTLLVAYKPKGEDWIEETV